MTAIAAVIPVIDEAAAIGDVVAGLLTAGVCCAYVVDGGSTDGTAEAAETAGGIVVHEPRRGYGRACLTGADRAIGGVRHAHDIVVFLDGDGSCDPASVPGLVDALATSDVALGRRPGGLIEAGAMPWHARLGNGLVASIIALRTGRRVHDLPPAKALRSSALTRLQLDEPGYGWTVQFVGRASGDPAIRVREIPVAFRRRRGGTSKVSGSAKASTIAAAAMLRVAVEATRPRPVVAMMAKGPGTGRAKTRLSADLGVGPTAELWAACLHDSGVNLLEAARLGGMDPILMIPGVADVRPVVSIVGPHWSPYVQQRSGLTGALIDVFLQAFDRGTDRAIAVAGDVPSLPPAYAVDALHRLSAGSDAAVLGPSADGGYHLVGLRWAGTPRWWPRAIRGRNRARLARRLRTAFDIPMGGSTALVATTHGLTAAGWRVTGLGQWTDIDTIDDLRSLARDLDGDGRFAPRTAAWLEVNRTLVEDSRVPDPTR